MENPACGQWQLVGIAALGMMLTVACASHGFRPADGEAILQSMDDQAAAWNRGDIPGFMEAYADSICFIGKGTRTCGKAEVTARYSARYSGPEAMGHLEFGELEVLGAGKDNAWCTGTWRLLRAQDTLGGGFSLFWVRTRNGWRILRDHTY